MPHVTIVIAGKTYRVACADGEEAHLTDLAEGFDARVAEMRRAFGEIGDMRLHVMAALTVSDELNEARRRIADLERAAAGADAEEARIAGSVGEAAQRIERLARALSGNPGAHERGEG